MGAIDTLLKRIGIRRELEQAQVGIEFIEAPERVTPPRRIDPETGKLKPLPKDPAETSRFIIMGMPPPPGEEPDYLLNNNGYMPTNYFMLNYFPEYGPETPTPAPTPAPQRAYLGAARRWSL